MRSRRVSKQWKEDASRAVIPLADFEVNSVRAYKVMVIMARALPNLQQITLRRLQYVKYVDGENPNLNRDIDYVADSESPLYRMLSAIQLYKAARLGNSGCASEWKISFSIQ